MCNNFPNIRITEGNNFSIILPLLSRTYVATRPIDEEIDPEQLENVVVTFGGVQYTAQRTERGVQIDLPATLAVGTYNILLTAEYLGSNIRAAYESAVTIVPWSEQSTAEQYIAGSPIVLRAAYVLGAHLSDAELEALKEEYREKNAQLQQAIEDAEAAKREWEEKAADLDGVAKESTSQSILDEVENIDIDTSDLAKQGTNPNATNTAILQAIAAGSTDSKQTIVDAINQMGGSATTSMTWAQLAQQIEGLQKIHDSNEVFIDNVGPLDYTMVFATSPTNSAIKNILKVAYTSETLSVYTRAFENCTNLEEVYMPNATYVAQLAFRNCTNIKKANFMNATDLYHDALETLPNLIDLTTGAAFASNVSLYYWNPAEALKSDSSSLVDAGEMFSNNLEKFLYNIREHFAANLQDRTGLTSYSIRFYGNVKAAILADQPTADAFTSKGWTIA